MSQTVCPNCQNVMNSIQAKCDKCNYFIVADEGNYVDLSNSFTNVSVNSEQFPGVYVYKRLLGKGEIPITLGSANLYSKRSLLFPMGKAAGGKLLLTNKTLSFSAHKFNVGRKELVLDLKDIVTVEAGVNLGISQHIIVRTATEKYRLVVYNGQDWIDKINYARNAVTSNVIATQTSPNVVPQPNTYNKMAVAPTAAAGDYSDELRKLKGLLDDGIITQEEFDVKKKSILGL